MEKKFEMIENDFIEKDGIKLFRIVALKDFGGVVKGDFGGRLEKESNLSQENDCWVYFHAQVSGEAQVYGNARVYDEAWVCGEAQVYGNARVYDEAWVCGKARVCDEAWVFGKARVHGKAWVFGKARVCE
jgi:carbonic anhydrase/acetyltransferase-like protein (isoleucine patch superfamily)